ncbi:MAG: porin [Betaproteobacteria bacterium]|jgi:phosphate-selective porin OprO/OprP
MSACLVVAGLALPAVSSAQAQDETTLRVERLEQTVDSLSRQLEVVRTELKHAREQLERSGGNPASAPAPTRQEVNEALATAQEAKEQAGALQQRFEQQGVQANFTDGVVFQDPRGRWGVRLMGRAQLDYRSFLGTDEVSADTFSVRRARLGAQATLFKDYVVQVEGEFSGTSAVMTNGFLEAQWFPAARIRMGQFKPQFGLEQTLLDLQSDFQERALTQNLLDGNVLNYDRGIMVHGQPWAPAYYAFTVSNGTGTALDEQARSATEARADRKDLTFRGVIDFARLVDWRDTVLHAGYSWKSGRQANRQSAQADAFAAPAFRTEARGLTFFTPQSFFGAGGTTGEIERTLEALEFSGAWRSVRLTGEWWRGRYAGAHTPTVGAPTGFERDIRASYVSLLWLMTGEVWSDYYANGIWQKVRPDNRFSLEPGGGWGAWEAGLRYSRMDASDFRSANPPGTGQVSATSPVTTAATKAEAWTVQLKWIQNNYSRWLLSYVQTRFDTPLTVNGLVTDREEAILLRAQVDF